MLKFSGYVVVRRPEFSQAFGHERTASINNRAYRGVDRLAWYDLETRIYVKKNLEIEICNSFFDIEIKTKHLVGVTLVQDVDIAEKFYQFSSQKENELCYVTDINIIEYHNILSSEWIFIGYDVFPHGEWSLIQEGFFRKHSFFTEFDKKINQYGLFLYNNYAIDFTNHYIQIQNREIVEPIRTDMFPILLAIYIQRKFI